MAPVLFGVLGLSIDYGAWLKQQTQMQFAADAAALGAAKVYSDSQNASAADAHANSALSAHNVAGASLTAGLVDDGAAYRVTLRQHGVQYFSALFASGPPNIGVSAKASIETGPGPCILALDPDAGNALWLDSNAQITATGCKVHSNSSSEQGLIALSNSHITADTICVTGGYGGDDSHYNPPPTTGCARVSDPLADIAAPSFSGCDYNNLVLDNAVTTLNPGVYCGGLANLNNSIVTFSPGTYVIKDGPFYVDSNSQIQGTGVTFYLTGTGAVIHFDSNSSIDFTAPATGPLAGLIFFEDRNAPLNQEHYFDSNNISRLEGAIYLSRGLL
ncbi:MAG: pilus assembly protein, partial [Proteobacteria bacterium]|nr:pilus assembly protein [Pseudomonadota bacterium]